jgi:hypothetical protein
MEYSVINFAKLCGVKREAVYVYGRRGKLLIKGGLIDSEEDINAEFMKSKGIVELGDTSVREDIKIKEPPPATKRKKQPADTTQEVINTKSLNAVKLAKLNEEYRFAKLRNEKIEGFLINTEVVGIATSEVIQRYKMMFVQQTDQLIRDLCNENGISDTQRTSTLSRLIDIANEASLRANHESKIAIENSISDSLSMTK